MPTPKTSRQLSRGAALKEALSKAIAEYKQGIDIEQYKEQGVYRISHPASRTDKRLSPMLGLIYDCLCAAVKQEDDGWVNLDNKTIMCRIGTKSPVAISAALKKLSSLGLVEIHRKGKSRWLSPKPPSVPIGQHTILIPWFILKLDVTPQEKLILAAHLRPDLGGKYLSYLAKVLGCGKAWLCSSRRKFIAKGWVQQPMLSTGFRYQTNPKAIISYVNQTKMGTLTKPKPYISNNIDKTKDRSFHKNEKINSAFSETLSSGDISSRENKSPANKPMAADLKKKKYKRSGPPPTKNALVEYWNGLPYGRKHRPSSLAYKQAAKFFRAMLKGQLYRDALDPEFVKGCKIQPGLILKAWSAKEIKQTLDEMNKLFAPSRDSKRLPKDLNNLLLHSELLTSRFLMVAQHGVPSNRKPGRKIAQLEGPTEDVAKIIVQSGGVMNPGLMKKLNYNLIELDKQYKKDVLPYVPDWAHSLISPFPRYLDQFLVFIRENYNMGTMVLNPGWFSTDSIPYRRFMKWIDQQSGNYVEPEPDEGRSLDSRDYADIEAEECYDD